MVDSGPGSKGYTKSTGEEQEREKQDDGGGGGGGW